MCFFKKKKSDAKERSEQPGQARTNFLLPPVASWSSPTDMSDLMGMTGQRETKCLILIVSLYPRVDSTIYLNYII